jgi:formamidopyrimidine-DNA glycosylase
LSGGELRYRDMRKLKGIRLTDADGVHDLLAPLGPDACSITARELEDRLTGTRRQVKSALMDQAVIAGLGNLLADEILWRARIDPRRRTDRLERGDIRRLHARMSGTLRSSIRAACVPDRPSWLTGHRDEEPGHCPRCGTALTRTRVGGRTTVACPHCQPA